MLVPLEVHQVTDLKSAPRGSLDLRGGLFGLGAGICTPETSVDLLGYLGVPGIEILTGARLVGESPVDRH